MQLIHIIDGCLDAGDIAGAAAAVLAHPYSQRFDRPTVERLFAIGFGGFEPSKVDVAMLGLLGDAVAIAEEIGA